MFRWWRSANLVFVFKSDSRADSTTDRLIGAQHAVWDGPVSHRLVPVTSTMRTGYPRLRSRLGYSVTSVYTAGCFAGI